MHLERFSLSNSLLIHYTKGRTSDLDGEVVGHHAVPGGKVSVDELVGV